MRNIFQQKTNWQLYRGKILFATTTGTSIVVTGETVDDNETDPR